MGSLVSKCTHSSVLIMVPLLAAALPGFLGNFVVEVRSAARSVFSRAISASFSSCVDCLGDVDCLVDVDI